MKGFQKTLFGVAYILVLFFSAGCKDPLESDQKPDILTEIADCLDSFGKNGPEDPIPLPVNLDLAKDWEKLLTTLSFKGKYVDLDISGSTGMPTFNPGTRASGKGYIVILRLPATSTSIAGGTQELSTFRNFANLREIHGKNIKTIGSYSFNYLGELEKVNFPALIAINAYAFAGCGKFTGIPIPEGMTSIGAGTFSGTGLIKIIIPKGISEIGAYAFEGCKKLADISIPESVKRIANNAFNDCEKLTEITIPIGVEKIEESTFRRTGVSNIMIPDSVTEIGSYAFYGCTNLVRVTIPDGVTKIGSYAFYGCTRLVSIEIPAIEEIGNYAFSGTGLTAVEIPDGIENIWSYAFANCTWLTGVKIPGSVNSIGIGAFMNCRLTNVTIPNSVKEIKANAFSGCRNIAEITIPAGVTIGASAFAGCWGLASVTFEGTIPSNSFSSSSPFPGKLRDEFYALDASNGTPGTYITENPGNTDAEWIKKQ